MIQVLQIGFSSNPGGVENIVMNYYSMIDKAKFQFDFLDIYGDGIAFSERIQELGGKVIVMPNYKKHPITFFRFLTELLKKGKYDIVHIHMQSLANILPILAGKFSGNVQIICHSHSSSVPNGLARKVLNWVNTYIIRHMDLHKWACGLRAGYWMWGKDFSRDNVIPNAIDRTKYCRDLAVRESLRRSCGFTEEEIVLGFVGRFGEEKNTFHLLDVLEELLNRSDHYRLLTVGGNDLYEDFVKIAQERELSKYIYCAGIQSDTYRWYSAMDAFLLPSFFEGFPLVGVEAQSAGLPCFFSNSISDEIKICDAVDFLPIGEGTATLWATCIENRMAQPWQRREFCEQYDIRYATKYLEKKYRSCIMQGG